MVRTRKMIRLREMRRSVAESGRNNETYLSTRTAEPHRGRGHPSMLPARHRVPGLPLASLPSVLDTAAIAYTFNRGQRQPD